MFVAGFSLNDKFLARIALVMSLLIHGAFELTDSLTVGVHWCITDINVVLLY